MTNHKFTVENHERTICFSLTPDEAREAHEWLKAATINQLRALSPQPPMIISELYGGLSAIAENRRYGGH